MKLVWHLMALKPLMMSSTDSATTRPSSHDLRAPANEYREAVVTSGRRPRYPEMSGVSTGRLILEGAVEDLRTHRLYQHKKLRDARATGAKEKRIKRGRDRRDGGEERRPQNGGHRRGEQKGDGDGHGERRRQWRRRSVDQSGYRRRRHHRERSSEGHDDRSSEQQKTHMSQEGPSQSAQYDAPALPNTGCVTASTVPLDPDGTPSGLLPTTDKGAGLFSQVKNMYKHVKAEQDFGHRSKGFAERHIDAFLHKRKASRGGQKSNKEELLIEDDERSGTGRSRRRHRRPRRDELHVFVPFSHDIEHQEAPVTSKTGVSSQYSTPFLQESPSPSGRSRRASSTTVRSLPPIMMKSAGDSQAASRTPTIWGQSPSPPERGKSILHESSATNMPYPVTDSVMDPPEFLFHTASPVPPPPPPPLPPSGRTPVDLDYDAFLVSTQTGAKHKRVCEEDEKAGNIARKDKARINDVHKEVPVYDESPHSRDVEALEHAQAVEESEKRQDVERDARTKPPLTAPQPKMSMPADFQDELATQLNKMKLNKQTGEGARAGRSEPNDFRARGSYETWRTVFAEQEEDNRMPDWHFRQNLGNRLSRPSTGKIGPSKLLPHWR